MNGISSNLKEELKKSSNNKNKEKFKFIATILLTNILVAMICLPSQSEAPKQGTTSKKMIHPDHEMLVLPLSPLLTLSEDEPEQAITLISKNKKIIIRKAFLHEEASRSMAIEGGVRHFKVEIHRPELAKIQLLLEEDMVAVPYVKAAIMPTKNTNRNQGSKYETNL